MRAPRKAVITAVLSALAVLEPSLAQDNSTAEDFVVRANMTVQRFMSEQVHTSDKEVKNLQGDRMWQKAQDIVVSFHATPEKEDGMSGAIQVAVELRIATQFTPVVSTQSEAEALIPKPDALLLGRLGTVTAKYTLTPERVWHFESGFIFRPPVIGEISPALLRPSKELLRFPFDVLAEIERAANLPLPH